MFILMGTQWRQGAAGPCGLDYSILFQLMTMYDVPNRQAVFEGVRDMELAVLNKMSEE